MNSLGIKIAQNFKNSSSFLDRPRFLAFFYYQGLLQKTLDNVLVLAIFGTTLGVG